MYETHLEILDNYDFEVGEKISSTYIMPYEYTCLCSDSSAEKYPSEIISTLNKYCNFCPPGTKPVYADQLICVSKKENEVLEYTVRHSIPMSYFNHYIWEQFCQTLEVDHLEFFNTLLNICLNENGERIGWIDGITYLPDGTIKNYRVKNNQFNFNIFSESQIFGKIKERYADDPKYSLIILVCPYTNKIDFEIMRQPSTHVFKLDMSKDIKNIKILHRKADYLIQKEEFIQELIDFNLISESHKVFLDDIDFKREMRMKFIIDDNGVVENIVCSNLIVQNFNKL